MLKELSNRLDKFSSTPTKAAAGKVTVTGGGNREIALSPQVAR